MLEIYEGNTIVNIPKTRTLWRTLLKNTKTITVAERAKTEVSSCLTTGIAGSTPAESTVVRLFCFLCG